MTIRVVTASAGSGKTYRLTQILEQAIASGEARPEHVLATTFTNQAAAELVERARRRLLAHDQALASHRLMAARIGTVNSVAGSLVTDFAFELGLSPALRVLDEAAAELELRRALARVVSTDKADELQRFKYLFDNMFDWRIEVRRIVEAARANLLSAEALEACAERSCRDLDDCLGPVDRTTDHDAALVRAIERAIAGISTNGDDTSGTADYVEILQEAVSDLGRGRLRWGGWAKLTTQVPRKKSLALAAPVQAAAANHLVHPRLRDEMHRLIRLLFEVAGDGLAAYQASKRERGVIDFVDQEAQALDLLRRADVRGELAGLIDLVLVDEFQDTSPIQLALFLELARLAGSSVWVGDPKQAIFGFRGTDPALMDAAIESLTSPRTDPDLVDQAARAVAGEVETLSTSYRSRPELVALTSDLFVAAFAELGMDERQVRLTAALERDPADLGPVLEVWPLELQPKQKNEGTRAAAVAAGVRRLLGERPPVRDRWSGAVRPLAIGDVAVLCRTNKQCQAVAEALAALGIAAVVPRMGLLDTAEGALVHAGLALWLDPRDVLAAAEIARLITHPEALDPLVERSLATPGMAAFGDEPAVVRLLEARAARPDLGPLEAFDAVVEALEARALAAGWGDPEQRLANLDAFRAHAVAYAAEAVAGGEAVTLPGLLRYLASLVEVFGFNAQPSDAQALLGAAEAVTISTWHRAKGLEWPISILYGLETLREPQAYGLHVLSDREAFDADDPLGGRWLRFWPNPYTNSVQNGPVKDAYAASPSYDLLVRRAEREALRVLYVGWTRARDRLVLAAERGKMMGGLLGMLRVGGVALIDEPPEAAVGATAVRWAGRDVTIDVRPIGPAAPAAAPPRVGEVVVGGARRVFAPARLAPSAAEPIACEVGVPVVLGPRLALRGGADIARVGDAVHGFLAADRPGLSVDARRALAEGLLARFGVTGCLAPDDVLGAASRLWAWVEASFPGARLHREWPVAHRLAGGTLLSGTADLVVRAAGGVAVIDHKTFPGVDTLALEKARGFSGQLAAYAAAIAAATATPVTSTWIHFPVIGQVVELRSS